MKEPKLKSPIPKKASSFAVFMFGEFLILAGLFMVVLGIGRLVSEFMGNPGLGELLVGIGFGIVGYALLLHARPKQIIITQGAQTQEQPPVQVKDAPSESYR